jgi:phosphosulfolactate phosphohydrolase-like enzyme
MAKKQQKHRVHVSKPQGEIAAVIDTKPANSLKDMLGADALAKLKQVEQEIKAEQERAAQEAAERKRRELEEKERNKSFGELLEEYDKKGGGKYR